MRPSIAQQLSMSEILMLWWLAYALMIGDSVLGAIGYGVIAR